MVEPPSDPCHDLYVHRDDSGRRAVHFTVKHDTLVPTTRLDYRVRRNVVEEAPIRAERLPGGGTGGFRGELVCVRRLGGSLGGGCRPAAHARAAWAAACMGSSRTPAPPPRRAGALRSVAFRTDKVQSRETAPPPKMHANALNFSSSYIFYISAFRRQLWVAVVGSLALGPDSLSAGSSPGLRLFVVLRPASLPPWVMACP